MYHSMPIYKAILVLLTASGLFLSQWSAENRDDRLSLDGSEGDTWALIANARNPEFLRSVVLGYSGFASSILWVDCIFVFADKMVSNKDVPDLGRKIRAVVALDPEWKYPYEFAGLVLESSGGKPDFQSVEILAQGVQRFSKDGRLALIYSQLILKAPWMDSIARLDSAKAVLLPLATGSVDAPEFARTLAITMIARTDGPETALRQLLYLWHAETSPLIRQSFANKLPQLVESAFDLDGDSLRSVTEGIEKILASTDPEVFTKLDHLVQNLGKAESRQSAFSVLREMGRQSN